MNWGVCICSIWTTEFTCLLVLDPLSVTTVSSDTEGVEAHGGNPNPTPTNRRSIKVCSHVPRGHRQAKCPSMTRGRILCT